MRSATLHNKKSFSHADKRAGVELWKAKVPQKAMHVQGRTEQDFGLCQGQPSNQDGQQRLPEKPGDLHAQEAPGGDPEGWVDYPLLKQCL